MTTPRPDLSTCNHDWLDCGEFHPMLTRRWSVVCTKCRKQGSVSFGFGGSPRIDWLEFWALVGEEPPTINGRDMTKMVRDAVVDPNADKPVEVYIGGVHIGTTNGR